MPEKREITDISFTKTPKTIHKNPKTTCVLQD